MKIIRGLLAILALGWITVLGAASSVPTVSITTVPLYGRSQNVHPNLMLSLSVEFPTTGAAYRGTYDKTQTYLGYFNPAKCYTYDSTNGWFAIAGAANTSYECSGQFSGNFMNWAASSAIDEFRMAMTGGDRVVDTKTQTVLQRAVLQGSFFRSSSFFPVKSINGNGNVSAPNKVTPFTSSTLYMASCGNHIFFSSVDDSSASCGSPGKYANQSYRVQVQVCDSNEATTRTDLCQNYNGNYKPVGQMQLNADRMRFAAFGYLNDSTNNTSLAQNERYGGVLRAPMKYVGSTAVDTNLNTIANPAPEFDASTGIFATNPLNRSEGSSGVINYLNKFGRTSVQLSNKAMGDLGGPTDNPTGNYKTYDPVSEMFYESIRYLQFKQGPTPDAVSGITTTYADNFPVYTTWDVDPMLNGCQRNYAFLIGDINTHEDHYIPGNQITNQGDPARPVSSYDNFDVHAWTNKVGALETNNPAAGNNNPLTSSYTNLGDINHPTAHWASYYLAGVAYWAHTYGFRPDMPNARVTTFVIDVNENGNGTVGATQRQSQFFLAAKYGGFIDANNDGNPFMTYGPDGVTVVNNNTEWEASPTGSNIPYNWFLGGQPATMIAAIKNIFAQIVSYAGTLSGVALSSTRITGTSGNNTYVYAPGFDQKWNGRLAAYLLTLSGTNVQVSNTATWEAGSLLTTAVKGSGYSTRAVYTLNSANLTGGPFTWMGISPAQQALLNTNPDTGAADTNGQARLNYLRGDQSNESNATNGTGLFRSRNSVLGDIIGSAPTYVGNPSATITDASYGTFSATYTGRTPMIYVGANDGMVHGFNANSGAEVFAYVPNAVFSNLTQLTSTAYAHRLYVDATPVSGEAQVNGNWRTVLTGGFGGGAQGVYALDVTDPTGSKGGSFSGSNVLWEFTDQDDPDMGNVMGTPLIVKLQTGTDKTVTPNVPIYKWFVMVANGLNSNAVDGSYNPNAPAALFLLSLDKPAGTKWTLNSNYYKIVTPIPSASPPYTTANGLSTPAIVPATNGRAMIAYAGDLQGNLWKFILSGDSTTWNANSALPAYGGAPGKPLFAATDNYSNPGRNQPITMAPQVVYAPGGYMVLFGTGKYYESSDTGTPTQYNSFYGIYDDNSNTNYVTDRSKLNGITATPSADGKSYIFSYATSSAAIGYNTPRKPGWVVDFPDHTEKQVTAAVASDGVVYFNTITGGDACGNNGSSRSYALNALSGMPFGGTTSGYQSSTGLLGAPSLIVVNIDLPTGGRDSVGGTVERKTKIVLSPGTQGLTVGNSSGSGGSGGSVTQVVQRRGRTGWREVRNFTLN